MYINISSRKVHYTDHGEGEVVLLLHGFMESVIIWESLEIRLAKSFRVISIDLPGHGNSDDLESNYSLDNVAALIKNVLSVLKIDCIMLVAHSMGGYIGLALLEKYPELLDRLILLHSKANGDSEEIKSKRDLGIKMLEQHPSLFIKDSIKSWFWQENLEKHVAEIDRLVLNAKKAQPSAYINALLAMKKRPDRRFLLKPSNKIYYIIGKNDTVIPLEISKEEIETFASEMSTILDESGHMGLIEEKEKCEKCIEDYLNVKHH